MTWGAASAKAKFSALLDEADIHGPQTVQRRKQQYLVVTKEQWDERVAPVQAVAEPFVNAWDALRVAPEFRTDEDIFVRYHDPGRKFEF